MTLPLWAIIGLTLLATLGIYMTLKVAKRDVTIIEMDAHIQELRSRLSEQDKTIKKINDNMNAVEIQNSILNMLFEEQKEGKE